MVSTFTPNIQLEEPARGDQVGTWDTPVNSNMTLIDLVTGGTATIPVAGAGIVLATAQYQSKTIVFNSTLQASIIVTFPTSFTKSYEILNQTTGSSNFTITLKTTAAGATAICVPPGEATEVMNIGASFYYKNLARVGTYWDYGGSSVPNWVSGCTVPPYLHCDGTAFSSATYPALYVVRNNSTVLPDTRGRSRFNLNSGIARMTAAISGVDGDLFTGAGGNESVQQHAHTGTTGVQTAGHTHDYLQPQNKVGTSGGGGAIVGIWNDAGGASTTVQTGGASANHQHNFTSSDYGVGGSQNVPPAYIGGITMIRAG